MLAIELDMQQRNTLAYIAADPSVIVLNRTTLVPDGAGGLVKSVPSPVAAQTFRIVNGQIQQIVTRTLDGQEVRADYMMICRWDADVHAGDSFSSSFCNYRVTYVYPDPTYELLAEVAFVGRI
jgi:hypothetical protein